MITVHPQTRSGKGSERGTANADACSDSRPQHSSMPNMTGAREQCHAMLAAHVLVLRSAMARKLAMLLSRDGLLLTGLGPLPPTAAAASGSAKPSPAGSEGGVPAPAATPSTPSSAAPAAVATPSTLSPAGSEGGVPTPVSPAPAAGATWSASVARAGRGALRARWPRAKDCRRTAASSGLKSTIGGARSCVGGAVDDPSAGSAAATAETGPPARFSPAAWAFLRPR